MQACAEVCFFRAHFLFDEPLPVLSAVEKADAKLPFGSRFSANEQPVVLDRTGGKPDFVGLLRRGAEG